MGELVGVTPECALCVFWASRLRPSGHDWCARHGMTPQHARGDDGPCGAGGRSFTARGEP